MCWFPVRLRLRQPRRSVTLAVIFVAIVTITCVLRSAWKNVQCSTGESLATLKKLCQRYHEDKVAGNLCPHLCDYRTLWFEHCANYRGGKQVLKAQWMDETIVLKSKSPYITDYDLLKTSPNLADFISMVHDSAKFNLPKKTVNDKMAFFKHLWMDDADKYMFRAQDGDGQMSVMWLDRARDSLWSLLQQSEYLLSQVYSSSQYFPRILGTCGHFYAAEYVPSGPLLETSAARLMGLDSHPWWTRARLALELIKAMEDFETRFEEPLHICDMKGDNFGVSSDNSVKVIDADMVVLDSRLKSDLSYPNCTRHDDCSFFDCRGWCDVPKHTCTDRRLNDNFQSLCEKILQPTTSNLNDGLLKSPPSQFSEITQLLEQCSNPPAPSVILPGCTVEGTTAHCPVTDDPPLKFRTDPETVVKLKSLIEASLGSPSN